MLGMMIPPTVVLPRGFHNLNPDSPFLISPLEMGHLVSKRHWPLASSTTSMLCITSALFLKSHLTNARPPSSRYEVSIKEGKHHVIRL